MKKLAVRLITKIRSIADYAISRNKSYILNWLGLSDGYSLVRLDNASYNVPVNDNLYNKFIPYECKGIPFNKHKELIDSVVLPNTEDLYSKPSNLMLMYLDVLFSENYKVHLLDVGSWIGDVAIRLGVFAKLRGGGFSADCIDPSAAGKLIPYNVELNGLSNIQYKPIGISLDGLPQIFSQIVGHSDSSRLANLDVSFCSSSYLIHTKTLEQLLPKDISDTDHIIVKIDVEGIDALIFMQNKHLLNKSTVIIEFAPNQKQYNDIGAVEFIDRLMENHHIFDIFYLPRPTMATPIISSKDFVSEIKKREFGYTDILAIPKSLDCHDKISSVLNKIKSQDSIYALA